MYITQTQVGLVADADYPLKDSLARCSLPAHNQTAGVAVRDYTCYRYCSFNSAFRRSYSDPVFSLEIDPVVAGFITEL